MPPYGKEHVVTVNEEGEPNILMLDSRAAAGFMSNYGNAEYISSQPAFSLPGYKFRGKGLIALQVTGDSMMPTIKHDDWLIARPLVHPLEEMREGYVHLLVTRYGCVAKRLYRAPKGRPALLCKSDNSAYPDYEQPIGEHDRVYLVLALLSEDLSNLGDGLQGRLIALEKAVTAIQAKLGR